jgi:NH3-dependent NAD+ synthetase
MERRGEHDRRAAHAGAGSGERADAVEIEGVEVAVPGAFDEAFAARLDTEAVANEQRSAGTGVRAPGERRQQRERLVFDVQDAVPSRSDTAGACRSCIRPVNAARSHSSQTGRR